MLPVKEHWKTYGCLQQFQSMNFLVYMDKNCHNLTVYTFLGCCRTARNAMSVCSRTGRRWKRTGPRHWRRRNLGNLKRRCVSRVLPCWCTNSVTNTNAAPSVSDALATVGSPTSGESPDISLAPDSWSR